MECLALALLNGRSFFDSEWHVFQTRLKTFVQKECRTHPAGEDMSQHKYDISRFLF